MNVFEEMMKQVVANQKEPITDVRLNHEHIETLTMQSTREPLPCGSQYFIKINDFALGLEYDQVILLRDQFADGIEKMLEGTKKLSEPVVTLPCMLCGKATTTDNAFEVSLGWMHFECEEAE